MSLLKQPLSLKCIFTRGGAKRGSLSFGHGAGADWEILFFGFLILCVIAVSVSVFMYGKIDKGEIFLVDKKEPVVVKTLDKFQLEKTISYFADKQEGFDALKRDALPTVDPFVPSSKSKK